MKKKAFLMIFATGLLYAVVSLILAASGAVPLVNTMIPIEVDNYYFWQMVLSLPFVAAVWAGSALLMRAAAGSTKRGCGFGTAVWGTGPAVSLTLIAALGPGIVEAAFMAMGMEQPELVGYISDPGIWQYLYFAFYIAAMAVAWGTSFRVARKGLKASKGVSIGAAVLFTAFIAGAFAVCIR